MSVPDTESDPALTARPQSNDGAAGALPSEIERAIREFSAEYLNHVGSLSKAFENFYSEQLAGRDERLRDLTLQLSASQQELEQLRGQLAETQQAHEALRQERHQAEDRFAQLVRRMREMSDGLERELGTLLPQPTTDGDGDRSDGRRQA